MTLAAQPTTDLLTTINAAIRTAWADLVCGLYINIATPAPTVLYADLTQPVYTGYTRPVMTIGGNRGNANGDIIIPAGMATFQPTGSTGLPITVTGSFLAKTAATPNLQLFEPLTTPWVITSTGSALDVIWEEYTSADPDYGGICTTCVV